LRTVIDVECPHCKRVLKIPEKYAGVEGACKHCGGRIVIPGQQPPSEFEPSSYGHAPGEASATESASRQETIKALTANIEVLHAQLFQNRSDIERLAKELESERVAKIEAEVARDVAMVRMRRAEENLAAIGSRNEDMAMRAEFERMQAKLVQSRHDIETLARELETERVARAEAEAARDVAMVRVRRVEEGLAALREQKGDEAVLQSELERARAKAAQAAIEAERLARDLEAERAARAAAEMARAEAEVARDVAQVRVKRLEANLAAMGDKGEDEFLRGELERSEARLAQSRQDVERLANELESERQARIRAETAHRMIELRTRRVQEQFRRLIQERTEPKSEAVSPSPEPVPPHAAVEPEPSPVVPTDQAEPPGPPPGFSETDSTASAIETADIEEAAAPASEAVCVSRDVEPVCNDESELEKCIESLLPSEGEIDHAVAIGNPDLEPESSPPAETETPEEEPAGPAPTPTPTRSWVVWAAAAVLIVAVAAGIAGYSTRALWMPVPSSRLVNPPEGGVIEASVTYMTSRQPEALTVPAARAPMVLARQQFDAPAFQALLEEAGVPQTAWAGLAEWLCFAEPDIPDAKSFPAAEIPDSAPFADARKTLAAFADKTGRDAFNARLAALFAYALPPEWAEETATDSGALIIRNLVPGRYALLARPEGPREAWKPIDPSAKDLTTLVVRQGETARCTLKLVDSASAIRGKVADGESGKPVPKATVVVSGDFSGGKKITVVTKEDGTFMLDPLETGYGSFIATCAPLPKGYLSSTTFDGTRELGVALAPGLIQISKKAAPKETRKTVLSGRVLASDGTPAAGFGIWVVGEDGSAKSLARSGRDGTYEFPHSGGTMRLYAAGPGSARTEPVNVELQASQSATRDFVLPPCGRIVLSIKKPDGTAPEAFEECNLVCSSRVMSDPGMLQRDGDTFIIPYLVGGVYDLTFRVKGFKPVSLPAIEIDKNGGDRELSVALAPLEAALPPPQ